MLFWTSPGTNLFPHLEGAISTSPARTSLLCLCSRLGIHEKSQFLPQEDDPVLLDPLSRAGAEVTDVVPGLPLFLSHSPGLHSESQGGEGMILNKVNVGPNP